MYFQRPPEALVGATDPVAGYRGVSAIPKTGGMPKNTDRSLPTERQVLADVGHVEYEHALGSIYRAKFTEPLLLDHGVVQMCWSNILNSATKSYLQESHSSILAETPSNGPRQNYFVCTHVLDTFVDVSPIDATVRS